MVEIDLDHRQIGLLIHAHDFGVMARRALRFALELHANAVGLLNHVAIRDDITLRIDDDSRAQRPLANRARVLPALAAEKLVEEILERAVVATLAALVILIRIGTSRSSAAVVRILDS